MKTEDINLLLKTIIAFWSPWLPRWAPEGREVSQYVIDRFHCITEFFCNILISAPEK